MHRWAVLSTERIQLHRMLVRDILLEHSLQLHELPRRHLCGIGGGLDMHQLCLGEELVERDRLDELHELRCGQVLVGGRLGLLRLRPRHLRGGLRRLGLHELLRGPIPLHFRRDKLLELPRRSSHDPDRGLELQPLQRWSLRRFRWGIRCLH